MNRTLAAVCSILLLAVAAPAAAAPPEESGAVIRIFDDTMGFGVFPDTTNGYWVFSNVTRDAFCDWFFDEEAPFPDNEDPDDILLVDAADAQVVVVDGGGPTALHAFTGDGPDTDPCTGSVPEASLTGDVWVRVTDNDGPNQGTRANSFGDRGVGELVDHDGNCFHYMWQFRGLWNPDGTEFRVVSEHFRLNPTG